MLGKPSQRYSRVATGSVWSRGAQPSSPCLLRQPNQVIRQYLRESDFYQNHALRVSIAETLSTFTICPKRSDGSGDLERVSAFVFKAFDFIWIDIFV